MGTYRSSGQYELLKARITTNTTNPVVLDVSQTFVDAVIYESIFDHTISGNITLVDTDNQIQKNGLGNKETIELVWRTAGVDTDPISVFGTVYDITPPGKINDHASAYILHFASPEFIRSVTHRMFSGYNATCSEIINFIIENISRTAPLQPKKLIASTSRNIEHVVFTGQYGLQAAQMVADRAMSSNGHRGFMFFEDNRNFRFVPIEELYGSDPVIEYTKRPNNTFDDSNNSSEESFNAIQDLQIETSNTFLDDITDGQYGSAWAFLSLEDKSMQIYNYDMKTAYDKSKSMGSSPVLLDQNFNEQYSDKLNACYGNQFNTHSQGKVDNQMKLLQSSNISLNMGVFGNSNIKVGDTCLASIPAYSSEDFSPDSHDAISGKFLIAEIKHILTPKMFTQRIKLIKDAYTEVVK